MNNVLLSIGALVPPIGVGIIFWLVMRWIVQADRRERAAQARLDAQASQSAGRNDPELLDSPEIADPGSDEGRV